MQPDTFFTEPPHWRWLIVLYFFIGGVAGGSFFIASLLRLFGRPGDRSLVRLGYYIAFIGAVISGILLIIDLGRPDRFWHMMLQSQTARPMFKYWSPMSVGVWGLLLFGVFSLLATLGALHEAGRLRWGVTGPLAGSLAGVVAVLGGLMGFFLAGYTGVLLSVTNRPIWADSSWLGVLYLFSAASSAAALLLVLARRRTAEATLLANLERFDRYLLVLELLVLVVFLITLGSAARAFLNAWGAALVIVAVGGILVPLLNGFGRLREFRGRALTAGTAATLVLLGGFMLRVVTIFPSEQVRVVGARVTHP